MEPRLSRDPYIPILIFGCFFDLLALLGFLTLFFRLSDVEHLIAVWAFIGSVSFFHLLLGIGIFLRKKWVFSIFKAYLHFLYLGFPVGTYLAHKTLKYIDEHNIERYLR